MTPRVDLLMPRLLTRLNMDIGALPERFGLLVFCGLVGLFAGGVRAALRNEPDTNPLRDVLANAAASALTAFLTACVILDQWGGRDYMTIAVSGLAGWAGATILDSATSGATNWIGRLFGRLLPGVENGSDQGAKKP